MNVKLFAGRVSYLAPRIQSTYLSSKRQLAQKETESSLMSEDCFESLLHQQGYIRNTIMYLIINSCRKRVAEYYARIIIKIILNNLDRYSLDGFLPRNSVMRNLANISSVESRTPTDLLFFQGSPPIPFEHNFTDIHGFAH